MAKKTIKPSLRFEIFKRDNFTCQYCGRKTPEVILELDHIVPRSKGGKEDIQNYLTSCFECNRGKSNTPLNQIKTRLDLKEEMYLLAEKELQLQEYYKLKEEINERLDQDLNELGNYFFCSEKFTFGPRLIRSIKYFMTMFTKYEIKECIDIALSKFPDENRRDEDCRFRYLCGILHNRRKQKYGKD